LRTALAVTDDITAIRKRIKLKELTVFETTLLTTAVPTENVWPAPSASSFSDLALGSLHQRIRPVGVARPRWSFERPGPHNYIGV
jgi:hypothetical protein